MYRRFERDVVQIPGIEKINKNLQKSTKNNKNLPKSNKINKSKRKSPKIMQNQLRIEAFILYTRENRGRPKIVPCWDNYAYANAIDGIRGSLNIATSKYSMLLVYKVM